MAKEKYDRSKLYDPVEELSELETEALEKSRLVVLGIHERGYLHQKQIDIVYPEIRLFGSQLPDGRKIGLRFTTEILPKWLPETPDILDISIDNQADGQLGFQTRFHFPCTRSTRQPIGLIRLDIFWLKSGFGQTLPSPKSDYCHNKLDIFNGINTLKTYLVVLKLAIQALTDSL